MFKATDNMSLIDYWNLLWGLIKNDPNIGIGILIALLGLVFLISEIVTKIIREVVDNKELSEKMKQTENLYGKNVSQKIVNIVKKVIKKVNN